MKVIRISSKNVARRLVIGARRRGGAPCPAQCALASQPKQKQAAAEADWIEVALRLKILGLS